MNYFGKMNDAILNIADGTLLGSVLNDYAALFSLLSLFMAGLICFSGYRWFRFWCSLLGFILFYALGSFIAGLFSLNAMLTLVISLACAVGGACIAFFLVKTGIFVLCAFVSFFFLYAITGGNLLISLLVAVAMGALSYWFGDILIILLTSVTGGMALGSGIAQFGKLNSRLEWILSVGMVIAGAVVQFFGKRRYRR